MSYLYASNKNNKIYMFSDTRVTFSDKEQDILFNILKKNSEDFENLKKLGIIKNVIINNNICIGSAGVLERFNELLKYIESNRIYDIESIKKKALEINIKYSGDTDFIIAFTSTTNKELYLVKDGQIILTDSCWIGSADTNRLFEQYKKISENIEEKKIDEDSFKKAIDDPRDEVVGGFFIKCYEKNGEFYYPEMLTSFAEKEHTIQPNGSILLFDSIANGGYSCYFYESKDVFSIYIYQMNRGIRYCPCIEDEQYNYLRFPKTYNLNEEEFIKNFNIVIPSIRIVF